MNAMTKVDVAPVVLQELQVFVSHTETHLTIAVPDEDAHHLAASYTVERVPGDTHALKIIAFVKGMRHKGRGVRPGKSRKLHGKDVRYMQFRPIPGLVMFAAGEGRLMIMSEDTIYVDLPNPLPAYKPHSGWSKRKGYTTQPDPDPVPYVAPALPTPQTEAPAPDRMTIAQAVKIVNAFLTDTPGAELEVVKETGKADRVRVSIVEVFE